MKSSAVSILKPLASNIALEIRETQCTLTRILGSEVDSRVHTGDWWYPPDHRDFLAGHSHQWTIALFISVSNWSRVNMRFSAHSVLGERCPVLRKSPDPRSQSFFLFQPTNFKLKSTPHQNKAATFGSTLRPATHPRTGSRSRRRCRRLSDPLVYCSEPAATKATASYRFSAVSNFFATAA